MKLLLIRDELEAEFTLGHFFIDGKSFGFTCEDRDRHLEDDLDNIAKNKVYGTTAIPRGKYKVTLSFSPHFKKVLPEIHDVPGFEGIRIHGGNTAVDTLGCILLGGTETENGCKDCASVVKSLIQQMTEATDEITLEIL